MKTALSNITNAVATWRERPLLSISPNIIHSAYKVPFQVEYLRETLKYRFIELLEASASLAVAGNYLAAIIIARSSQETLACLFYLNSLINTSISTKTIDSLRESVKRLLLGNKIQPNTPTPIHIMDIIRAVDKMLPGFLTDYDSLSEFVHPNWPGTLGLFAKLNPKNDEVSFGRYIRGEKAVKKVLEVILTNNMAHFQLAQIEYDKMSQSLIDLCIETHDQGALLPIVSSKSATEI